MVNFLSRLAIVATIATSANAGPIGDNNGMFSIYSLHIYLADLL